MHPRPIFAYLAFFLLDVHFPRPISANKMLAFVCFVWFSGFVHYVAETRSYFSSDLRTEGGDGRHSSRWKMETREN
jgi:hypothetical protein